MTPTSSYYSGSEASDYSPDQPFYYPLYYPTGYETPTNYIDQSQQYLQYSAEGGQYLYVQGYGYTYFTPEQYNQYPYQYVPNYQNQAPSGYVQFFIQPDGQPLTPPDPSTVNNSLISVNNSSVSVNNSSVSVNNSARLGNNNTKNRANASTSAIVSPVSLVTGASRSSHHNQITIKPSEQFSRDPQGENANSTSQSPNSLPTEHTTGPRTKSKSKSKSPPAENSYPSPISAPRDAIMIFADLYRGVDFSVDFSRAKFFVIKSYSEDDVHKSVKYGVWSSTPNGNRRLHAAYLAAQEKAARDPKGCPVFLFFSVNASGQFCGVAEMVGPVDFSKHVDFWQQDKWQGSFPVKWRIIKDVLHASFRHITLENNENKPVTNSRDTQEILYSAGMDMLKIFKNTPLTSSVLEDFPFYEGRQLAMLQDKCRRQGRVYESSLFTPAVVVKTRSTVDQDQPVDSQDNPDLESEEKQVESKENPELESEENLELESKEKLELESKGNPELESKEKLELESKEKLEMESLENLDLESKENPEFEVGSVKIKVKESGSEVVSIGKTD